MFLRGLPVGDPTITGPGGGPSPGDGSGWTQGSVIFADATGALNQDNAAFFWNDTDNRLGIGTNAPATGVQISSAVEATNSYRILDTGTSADARFGVYGVGLGFIGMVTSASMEVRTNNTVRATWSAAGNLAMTPGVSTSGSPTLLSLVGPAHTTLAASTEALDVDFDLSRTVQFSTGALSLQRAVLLDTNVTYAFSGASTLSIGVGLHVTAGPDAGANASISTIYNVLIGANRTAGSIPVQTIASSAGGEAIVVNIVEAAFEITGTTTIASTPGVASMQILSIDVTTTGAGVTVTNAATLYIEDAPTAGASVTITNNYALWVDAGIARFDGNGAHVFAIDADTTAPGAAAGRIPFVDTSTGGTRYIMVANT